MVDSQDQRNPHNQPPGWKNKRNGRILEIDFPLSDTPAAEDYGHKQRTVASRFGQLLAGT